MLERDLLGCSANRTDRPLPPRSTATYGDHHDQGRGPGWSAAAHRRGARLRRRRSHPDARLDARRSPCRYRAPEPPTATRSHLIAELGPTLTGKTVIDTTNDLTHAAGPLNAVAPCAQPAPSPTAPTTASAENSWPNRHSPASAATFSTPAPTATVTLSNGSSPTPASAPCNSATATPPSPPPTPRAPMVPARHPTAARTPYRLPNPHLGRRPKTPGSSQMRV